MTIRITIKNEGGEKQVIGIQEMNRQGDKTSVAMVSMHTLKGGEAREFTIWDTKSLEVFEVSNG